MDSFIWDSGVVGGLSLLNVVGKLDLPVPLDVISARPARVTTAPWRRPCLAGLAC